MKKIGIFKQTTSFILITAIIVVVLPTMNVLAQQNIEILDIIATEIDSDRVVIEWETNIKTKGKIIFGKAKDDLTYYIGDNKISRFHEVEIVNLEAETTYYYQIIAYYDLSQEESFIKDFETTDDDTPPKISNTEISYISGTVAVVTWETDEEATSRVEYDDDGTYKKKAGSGDRVINHLVILKNLDTDSQYFLRLYSEDKKRNKSVVYYKDFTTKKSDKIDKEDFTIFYLRPSGPNDPYISPTNIFVGFETNHYAKGKITIRRKGFSTQTRDLDYNIEHSAVFTDLTPNSAYTIKISMTDIYNKRTEEEFVATTKDIGKEQVIVEGIDNISEGQTVGYYPVCSADILSDDGYYGQYFDLPKDAPNFTMNKTSVIARDTGWYDQQYLAFSRIDKDIDFGSHFTPITSDYTYFSVYWRAILEIPADGDYEYKVRSDDDSWVFIDSELTSDLGGKHLPKTDSRTINLSQGQHTLEIFYAERKPIGSAFSFTIDHRVRVHPWPTDCSILPSYSQSKNNNSVIVAGIEYSYYTPASALLKTAESPDVYSILNGRRHYISSPSSFAEYGYNWHDIKIVCRDQLSAYPRVRLIKSPESPVIYYLYQKPEDKWLKINLTSPSVFISYPDNYWGNVAVVTQLDIDAYPDVKLIKTKDSSAIYYLVSNTKHFVSDIVFESRNFDKNEIVEVNQFHLDSYQTGLPLE